MQKAERPNHPCKRLSEIIFRRPFLCALPAFGTNGTNVPKKFYLNILFFIYLFQMFQVLAGKYLICRKK
nr:MAG TPA: hypothetical protein [Caudoviricetes sp.]